MKTLLMLLFAAAMFASCEEAGKCWECETKYLDVKTNKLLDAEPVDMRCDESRAQVATLEYNGKFTHPKLGEVRKQTFCEQRQ